MTLHVQTLILRIVINHDGNDDCDDDDCDWFDYYSHDDSDDSVYFMQQSPSPIYIPHLITRN